MAAPDAATEWKRLLRLLQGGRSLERADTVWAMNQVMSGATESEASMAKVAAFLFGLHAKGETAEEIDLQTDVRPCSDGCHRRPPPRGRDVRPVFPSGRTRS